MTEAREVREERTAGEDREGKDTREERQEQGVRVGGERQVRAVRGMRGMRSTVPQVREQILERDYRGVRSAEEGERNGAGEQEQEGEIPRRTPVRQYLKFVEAARRLEHLHLELLLHLAPARAHVSTPHCLPHASVACMCMCMCTCVCT